MISTAVHPRRILEIGTFSGYATICLARGLGPDGHLDTIEIDPERVAMIRKFLDRAALAQCVTLHLGDALTLVPSLSFTYDLIFVDAAKRDYARYYELALPKLSGSGLLIFDNVLWGGKVMMTDSDPDTRAIRAFNKMIRNDPHVHAVMLPIRDGMTMIQKQ